MPEEETKEPLVDEATIVHDDPVTAEEKADEEITAKVAAMLNPEDTPDTESEKPAEQAEAAEGEDETEVVEIDKQLLSRANVAGLSEDLTQRLHQTGQLEETLAAFDRGLIERFQKEETPKEEVKPKEAPPPKDQEVPALDPETYDEAIVKRDAYQTQRIDSLEQQLQDLIRERESGFDEWMDGTLRELGVDTKDEEKCQAVFRAYGAMCDAFGAQPYARDKGMVERAHAAMYPQDVFKQKQKQTVDRLRDAQGKFLSKSPAKAPPKKQMTPEESDNELLANVTNYLKEQGVQMSGY